MEQTAPARKAYPSDLREAEWAILEPLVPAVKPGGRPARHSRREIVNAILYVVRGGNQWRALPHDLPPWQTAYYSEGCEPLLQQLVVHDDHSSPWVVAGLMMDWPGLPAGSSAGIGHIDGLRRGALCLQERVG